MRGRLSVAVGGDLIGAPGQAGGEESVVDGGQVHRGVQAVVGDLVSVGVRDAGDEVEAGLSALGRDDPD
jgi:hypothetical protein